MAYNGVKELEFASGYYHIGFGGFGVVTFEEGTPQQIIDKFWEVWPSFREKVVEQQRKGIFTSKYPRLPYEDPEANRRNYEVKK